MLTGIPFSWRNDGVKRMYNITVSRMTPGELLNERKGFCRSQSWRVPRRTKPTRYDTTGKQTDGDQT